MCEQYLNTDVLFAPDNSNLYGRMVFCIGAMVLNDSSHGVLEQLEQHVVQMRWHVHYPDGHPTLPLCHNINRQF